MLQGLNLPDVSDRDNSKPDLHNNANELSIDPILSLGAGTS